MYFARGERKARSCGSLVRVCALGAPCPFYLEPFLSEYYRRGRARRSSPRVTRNMRVPSLVALINGGASGLGAATARRLCKTGAKVVIADLNGDAAKALVDELSGSGGAAVACAADCTSEADISAALDLAETHFGQGPVGAAVSTAGALYAAKTVSRKGAAHPLEPFEKVLKVNVLGSFNVARLSAARMATREPDSETGERGCIVQTASIAAFDGQAGQCAYSASKGAIVGMTLPMARDLAPLGVRVCTIAPGVFETPMMSQASDEVREGLYKSIPFPSRFGQPEEFSSFVETIIGNPYLNGETIRLDGAVRMT